MDELLAQFLIEGPELIQAGSDALLALEAKPDDRDLLDGAFRAIHTLKGSVALFDLPAMGRTLHAAEDVMGALRAGTRSAAPSTTDALLTVLSQCERWIETLERSGGLSAEDDALAARLIAALTDESPTATQQESADTADWITRLASTRSVQSAAVAVRYRPAAGSYFSGDDPVALAKAAPGLVGLVIGLTEGAEEGHYDPFTCRLTLDLLCEAPLDAVRAAFRSVLDQVEIAPVGAASANGSEPTPLEVVGSRTVRIDPRRIDSLAATAADLVAAKSGLGALVATVTAGAAHRELSAELAARAAVLERLAGRLHDDVMALRMAPIAPLLRRYPRLVRDLATALGKDVQLVVDDPGLEADKAILEGLSDPLTHLVRNAVDHGVEAPEDRRRAGKPVRALVRLSARREGGHLVIDLRDDGRGIDPEMLRRKLVERGVTAREALSELSDAAVLDMVFLPGFSTAEVVTDVSGRGVGMDAVRTSVANLGGRVTLSSELGAGACVTLILPLSIVLTKVLIVEASGERFGAPMDRVLETLKLPRERVSEIRAGRAFDWRGRTVPLISLSDLVGRDGAAAGGDLRVLVVQAAGEVIGVTVDAIVDRTDVVLRPLTGLLAGTPGVAGSAALGDGAVLMVLDIEALVS